MTILDKAWFPVQQALCLNVVIPLYVPLTCFETQKWSVLLSIIDVWWGGVEGKVVVTFLFFICNYNSNKHFDF